MGKLILRRAQFKKWLEGKKPREVVGMKGMASSCPIAHYLEEKHYVYPSVTSINIRWGYGTRREGADTPRWAGAFIRLVDLATVPSGKITAQRALRILEKCK